MNKYKNVFGELEFELGDYFVPHRTGCTNKYRILKHEPWYVTEARWAELPWDSLPTFDSWIQAVRFLKENVEYLL